MATQQWSYTHIVDDTSPMFAYSPQVFSDAQATPSPDPQGGWVEYVYEYGSVLTTYHYTGVNGALFSLDFYASSLVLYGTYNCTFSVLLDNILDTGNTANAAENILYSWNATAPAQHSVKLVASPNRDSTQQVLFDNATLAFCDWGLMVSGLHSTDSQPDVTTCESDDEQVIYAGFWNPDNDANVRVTSEPQDSVFLNFSGSAIEIFAPTDQSSGPYSIKLIDQQWNFVAVYPKAITDAQLFYMSGLDEGNLSTTAMTKTGDNSTTLGFSRMQVTRLNTSGSTIPPSAFQPGASEQTVNNTVNQQSSQQSSQQSNKHDLQVGPGIIGPVVGSVVLVVGDVIGLLYVRRRKLNTGWTSTNNPLSAFSIDVNTIERENGGTSHRQSEVRALTLGQNAEYCSTPATRALSDSLQAVCPAIDENSDNFGAQLRRHPSQTTVERLLRLLAFTNNAVPSESLPPYAEENGSASPGDRRSRASSFTNRSA